MRKWQNSDVFGGTKNDFPVSANALGEFYPQLLDWKPRLAIS